MDFTARAEEKEVPNYWPHRRVFFNTFQIKIGEHYETSLSFTENSWPFVFCRGNPNLWKKFLDYLKLREVEFGQKAKAFFMASFKYEKPKESRNKGRKWVPVEYKTDVWTDSCLARRQDMLDMGDDVLANLCRIMYEAEKDNWKLYHDFKVRKIDDVSRLLDRAETLLHETAAEGDWSMVAHLIKLGVSPDLKANLRFCPLLAMTFWGYVNNDWFRRSFFGHCLRFSLLFFKPRFDFFSFSNNELKMVSNMFSTPNNSGAEKEQLKLHTACKLGKIDIVLELLKNGQNPNAQNAKGRALLHEAAAAGNWDIVSVLLKHGANPDLKDNMGFAPLHSAEFWGQAKCGSNRQIQNIPHQLNFANGAEMFGFFYPKKSGADDKQWRLHTACKAGNVDIVLEHLEKGQNPNEPNAKGRTPLHEAAAAGNWDIVDILLEHGANPDLKDAVGFTPLHAAAFWGHAKCARALCERNANIGLKSNVGETAMTIAVNRNQGEVVQLLAEFQKRNNFIVQVLEVLDKITTKIIFN